MITIRRPEEIYLARGKIENGTFSGKWHFSFGNNYDPNNINFGTLRVFNDDTLSPGAVWPLHPHTKNEVVTYCAEGEFRHADQNGIGGILKKGWVQHTTIGTGMYHSEINNLPDKPMRFIQMWFYPEQLGLKPSVEQMKVDKKDRTNKLLQLVSNKYENTLPIRSDATVYSCFLEKNNTVSHECIKDWGIYLYVLSGGPIQINQNNLPELSAVKITQERSLSIQAINDAELLIIEVSMIAPYIDI
ncbi:MAG: pirin family protein [Promethearchaeota archaeon]